MVGDDAIEFGLFMQDRNKRPGEQPSFFKIVLNSIGSGEYMKIYPSIGQNMYNWQPKMKIANKVYEADGVFSPVVIDGMARKLQNYNDRDLSEQLFGKEEEIKKLVDEFLYC